MLENDYAQTTRLVCQLLVEFWNVMWCTLPLLVLYLSRHTSARYNHKTAHESGTAKGQR